LRGAARASAGIEPSAEADERGNPGALLVPYIPLLGMLVVLTGRTAGGVPLDGLVLVFALIVGFCLVFRQVIVMLDNAALQRSLERTLDELGERERHFRSLVQQSSDVIAVTDSDGRLTYVSPSVLGVLGYPSPALIGTSVDALLHPDDAGRLATEIGAIEREPDVVARVELRWRHNRAGWRHCETTITNLLRDPAIRGIVLNTRDVTDRKEAERELEHRARHDALTGLRTRGPFVDELTAAIAAAGPSAPVAVLFVDLDRFKIINDSLGHDVGDEVLVVAAARLQAALGAKGSVARFGGDEFVAMSAIHEDPSGDQGAPYESAVRLAADLVTALRRPLRVGGREVFLTCSVGVAWTTDPFARPDELIGDADLAMYIAKERGRARVELFDPSLRGSPSAKLDIETALHRAVAGGQLTVAYQPVVELQTGDLVALEALVRWHHPTRGVLGPDEFLGAAEATGLIVPIGSYVFETACTDLMYFRAERPDLRVSVNLSARQLGDPELIPAIESVVNGVGLDPSAVCFEVTEGVILDTDRAMAAVHRLRSLGFALAVDDFGTGYASLTHLRLFPATTLKIDKSFVAGLGVSGSDSAIVAATTHMARALGMMVVAEGIETHEQLAELQALGCPLGQGFLLGEPIPFDELVAQLRLPSRDRTATA
jgi:diguanylate cyclase (GGDEF)-like protein/PAS domain S-box-containing protein